MSIHAAEELDDDNFTIFDLENIILTGAIIARQRDQKTREVKYGDSYFTAQTLHEIERIKTLRKAVAVERRVPVAAFQELSA